MEAARKAGCQFSKEERVMTTKELVTMVTSARKRLGMTQVQLAKLVGVQTMTIYRMERGKGEPSLTTVLKVIGALKAHSGQMMRTAQAVRKMDAGLLDLKRKTA